MKKELKIKLVNPCCLPIKKTEGAGAYDCYACIDESVIINPGKTSIIPLGFSVEVPDGYYLEVRGRSGLSSKGIITSIGTVDSDYRGIVGAITTNTTDSEYIINPLDRICQIQLKEVIDMDFLEVSELSATERGNNGFGSTGIK